MYCADGSILQKGDWAWVDAEPNKDPYMNFHTAQSAIWTLEARDGMKNNDWEVVGDRKPRTKAELDKIYDETVISR
jgi:hypothetical protein